MCDIFRKDRNCVNFFNEYLQDRHISAALGFLMM